MNWLCPQKFIRYYNILHFSVEKYRRVTAFSGRLGVLPLSVPILNLIIVFKAGAVFLLKLITRANDSE